MTIARRFALFLALALFAGCDGVYVDYTKSFRINSVVQIRATEQFNSTKILDFSNIADAVEQIPDDAIITSVYITAIDASANVLPSTNANTLSFSVYLDDLNNPDSPVQVSREKEIGFPLGVATTLQLALKAGVGPYLEEFRQKINRSFSEGAAMPSYLVSVQGAPSGGRVDVDMTVMVDVTVSYEVCQELAGFMFEPEVGNCVANPL